MKLVLAVMVGKLLRKIVKLRGGGSAVPGRAALIIEPRLLERTLGSFRYGVILVSGSNGKSTTTSLAVAALESQGLKVFTNSSGSNMPRGIGSAVVSAASIFGNIDADIAVIEVDEGYALEVSKKLSPRWFVLTNIQIDQLNRFYEPDRVFKMLLDASSIASEGVIVNGSDPNLVQLTSRLDTEGVYQVKVSSPALSTWPAGALAAPIFGLSDAPTEPEVLATIRAEKASVATLEVSGREVQVSMPGKGLHYALATALAVAIAQRITGIGFQLSKAVSAIASRPPVYGRAETVSISGVSFDIMMMKNPPSMQANLVAMGKTRNNIWVAVDEGTPDTSWIYDIDFSGVSGVEVISGAMAWHLAMRLRYAGIPVAAVVPDTKQALKKYVDYLSSIGQPGLLLSNYEQMMQVRRLAGLNDLEGQRK
jgi:UDP-N-acetylmuramyl tripeptide synthase